MLFLISCAILLAAASADDLRPYNVSAAILFNQNDADNNGVLSRPEFDNSFKQYDKNGDNVIERNEYVCYITSFNVTLGNLAHALYDDFDVDHDHRLEINDLNAFYAKMDGNNDKQVSGVEFVIYWEKLFEATEGHSLHNNPHQLHSPKYCLNHGHAHG